MKDNATLDKLSGWAVENFQLPSLSSKLSKLINALDVKVDYEGDKNVYVYSLVSDSRLVVTEEDGNVVIRHRSDESVEPIVLKNSVIDKKVVYMRILIVHRVMSICISLRPLTIALLRFSRV